MNYLGVKGIIHFGQLTRKSQFWQDQIADKDYPFKRF